MSGISLDDAPPLTASVSLRDHALGPQTVPGTLVEYGDYVGGLERDMRSREVEPRVQEDRHSGIRSGVNGTPTFFIQGYRYNGLPDLASMLAAQFMGKKKADLAREVAFSSEEAGGLVYTKDRTFKAEFRGEDLI